MLSGETDEKTLMEEFRSSVKEDINIRQQQSFGGFNHHEAQDILPQMEHQGSKVTLQDLFEGFETPSTDLPTGHVMIQGKPGVGKTTILNNFAMNAQSGKIRQIKSDGCLVFMLDGRGFGENEKISLEDYLCRNMRCKPSTSATKVGVEWMLQNPDKVVFVIDSLDTLGYEVSYPFTPTQKLFFSVRIKNILDFPANLLCGILIGSLFPQCKILSASLEAPRSWYLCRGNDPVSVIGLKPEAVKQLVVAFLGHDIGINAVAHLEEHPDLIMLSGSPAFLISFLIGYMRGLSSGFVPKTMTGVMVNLLQSVAHSKSGEKLDAHIVEILKKMKVLSFSVTRKGKASFNEKELSYANVTMEEVINLSAVMPGDIEKEQKIVCGGSGAMHFAHESISNVLSAMHVAEMAPADFRSFITEHKNKTLYSVVRETLCGLLFDSRVNEEASKQLLSCEDMDAKKAVLANKIKRIGFGKDQSGDGKRTMNQLELDGSYTELDMFLIGSTLSRCRYIEEFKTSHLTKDHWQRLSECLPKDSLKIYHISIKCGNLYEQSASIIGNIVMNCRIQSLSIDISHSSSSALECLLTTIGPTKIDKIVISNNDFTAQSALIIGQFVKRCKVREVIFSGCKMSERKFQELDTGLGNAKVKKIHFARSKLDVRSMHIAGGLVKRCEVQDVAMRLCNLSALELKAFSDAAENWKIESFDISENPLDAEAVSVVGDMVKKFKIQEIKMCGVTLSKKSLEEFIKALGHAKCKIIDLSRMGWFDCHHDDSGPALSKLLDHVSSHLCLRGAGLLAKNRDMYLLQSLDKMGLTNLKITVDSGRHEHILKLPPTSILESALTPHSEYQADRYVVSKSLSRQVYQRGDKITIDDCVITIHEDSVHDMANVNVKLEIDSSKWPKGYIGITPTLHIEASEKFLKPVSVQLPSWCKSSGTEQSQLVLAHVLHQDEATSKWEVLKRPLLSEDTIFTFDCLDFSPVLVGLSEEHIVGKTCLVDGFLYADRKNNFTLAFCLTNKSVIDKFCSRMSARYAEPQLDFDTIPTVHGDKIVADVSCVAPPGFHFTTEGHYSFEVNDDFIKKVGRRSDNLTMTGPARHQCTVEVKCDVSKNDEILQGDQRFNYTWQPEARFDATSARSGAASRSRFGFCTTQ